jgi:hypothetical protein
MNVQVSYLNGILKISFEGNVGAGGHSGGNAGDGPIGGGSGNGGVRGGLILGPIVIPAIVQGPSTGGNAGDGPIGGNAGDGPIGGNAGDGPIGGGQGAGSGCCCPTVIGPIVFTDCCSSASSQPATPPSNLNINTVLAQAPTVFSPHSSDDIFEVPPQQEAQWCWSAVTVGVKAFVDSVAITQTELARTALLTVCSLEPNPDDPCNQPYSLNESLTAVGNLQPNGAYFNSIVAFADLQTYWNRLPLPVCARIVWDDGSGTAHFIAISGYREATTGQQLVLVHDPAPGAYGGPILWDYDLLKSSYQCPADPGFSNIPMPSGHWNDSYFVQPQS